MKRHDFPDLGRLMDDIFSAAEDFTSAFTDRMQFNPGDKAWMWNKEYYSAYSFPAANIYMGDDKTLYFEFAVAGYGEHDVNLEFKGDYMIFSGTVPEEMKEPEGVRYFKRRLKRKSFSDQRYYVPADKFDRERVTAVYKNGLLRVTIPPRDVQPQKDGVKINIVNEDENPSAGASGKEKK